ncbi:unnamed protein product [Blepharisma stoltei]|uniref:Uncharacterized protein n=1 Tax=Blepharisma stoltei TaxID=1481888 RepID=A0AAU9KE28_9CILI|nr:unnamed protein product [Blepharisma stoltei]
MSSSSFSILGKEKKIINVKESIFWTISGSITFCIIFSSILFGCMFSFRCSRYYPTISYLLSFRNHDRWIVFGITFYVSLLPLLFMSVTSKLANSITTYISWKMNIFGICGCCAILATGIIDEINGLYFLPLDTAHPFITVTGYLFLSLWMYAALFGFENIQLDLNEKTWLRRCRRSVLICHILFAITAFEWHFAYTIYSNFLVNEVVEALCEWSLVTLAISLPYQISKVTNTSIHLTWSSKMAKERKMLLNS